MFSYRFRLLLIGVLVLIATTANASLNKLPVDRYSDRFDVHFQKYSKRFFGPVFEWKYWKAQAICESALNPEARSHCDARGLMQVMLPTWNDIRRTVDIGTDRFDARYNICAGIYYDRQMYNIWSSKRSEEDRLKLVFASYNGGAGNVLKAQKKCLAEQGNNCNTWKEISARASKINTWRYEESLNYVNRIMKLMEK